MNRIILGAVAALALVGLGLFWLQGRAEVAQGAPPPDLDAMAAEEPDPEDLPFADVSGMEGPAPPEASELTREEQRFYRYDRNRDRRITRTEMMASRTDAFRRLDTDGNNLLTFEEWAITTSNRFAEMDADEDLELTQAEFATSAPAPRPSPSPRCSC